MATQYTAGLAQGQKLTAAIMNQIGAAWETWTPTYSASGGGAFTTVTTTIARYAQIQKLVFVNIDATVTTLGTASGFMQFSLPITANRARQMGVFREIAVIGQMGAIDNLNTTTAAFILYAGGNTAVANYRNVGTFIYEAA
jgi:hypothetical protein